MSAYAEYLAAIEGKNFPNDYFLHVTISNLYRTEDHGVTMYSGYADGYVPAPGISGVITPVNSETGIFSLGGVQYQIVGSLPDGNTLIFSKPDSYGNLGDLYALSNSTTAPGNDYYSTANSYNVPTPMCFVEGTRLLTVHGYVPIEELECGDILMGEGGRRHPVRWTGKRTIICDKNPFERHVAPVVFRQDAIAPGCPSRDLMVSPGHCLAIGPDWLVEAEHLVNGDSICRMTVEDVTYWHVEVDVHAVIYAEGVAVESFVDVGNKVAFDGEAQVPFGADRMAAALAGYCRPVAQDRVTIAALAAPLVARSRSMRLAAS